MRAVPVELVWLKQNFIQKFEKRQSLARFYRLALGRNPNEPF